MNSGQEIASNFSPILKSFPKYDISENPEVNSFSGSEVMSIFRFDDDVNLVQLPEQTMRISYTFYTNLKIENSQFLVFFQMKLSTISHASWEISTESEYVINQSINQYFKIFSGSCKF